MGSIDSFKPLSNVLGSAVSVKSRKKFLGTPIFEPWAGGCKARLLSIALCGPPLRPHFTEWGCSFYFSMDCQFCEMYIRPYLLYQLSIKRLTQPFPGAADPEAVGGGRQGLQLLHRRRFLHRTKEKPFSGKTIKSSFAFRFFFCQSVPSWQSQLSICRAVVGVIKLFGLKFLKY